jgi:hypothetical protein
MRFLVQTKILLGYSGTRRSSSRADGPKRHTCTQPPSRAQSQPCSQPAPAKGHQFLPEASNLDSFGGGGIRCSLNQIQTELPLPLSCARVCCFVSCESNAPHSSFHCSIRLFSHFSSRDRSISRGAQPFFFFSLAFAASAPRTRGTRAAEWRTGKKQMGEMKFRKKLTSWGVCIKILLAPRSFHLRRNSTCTLPFSAFLYKKNLHALSGLSRDLSDAIYLARSVTEKGHPYM